jgi:hypothetical protein
MYACADRDFICLLIGEQARSLEMNLEDRRRTEIGVTMTPPAQP